MYKVFIFPQDHLHFLMRFFFTFFWMTLYIKYTFLLPRSHACRNKAVLIRSHQRERETDGSKEMISDGEDDDEAVIHT